MYFACLLYTSASNVLPHLPKEADSRNYAYCSATTDICIQYSKTISCPSEFPPLYSVLTPNHTAGYSSPPVSFHFLPVPLPPISLPHRPVFSYFLPQAYPVDDSEAPLPVLKQTTRRQKIPAQNSSYLFPDKPVRCV